MSLVKAFDLLANCSWDGSLQAFGEAYLDALRPFGAKSLWSRSFQLTRNWHDPEVSGRYVTDDHARIRQADWQGSAAQRYADRHCPLAMGAARYQRPFFASEVAPRESRAYVDYWAAMAEFDVHDTFAASYFGPGRIATALSIWFTGTDFSPAELQAIRLSTVIAIDHLRAHEPEDDATPSLTPRERDCLAFVAEGKSDWEISVILAVSQSTVKFHVDNARRKLGAVNRAHAVARFLTAGPIGFRPG